MKRLLTCAALGGLAFYSPDILCAPRTHKLFVHSVPHTSLGWTIIIAGPVLLLVLPTWFGHRRFTNLSIRRAYAYSVAGVWSFGMLLIFIAGAIASRGTPSPDFKFFPAMLSGLINIVFPFGTLFLSLWIGTFYTLLLATLLVPVVFTIEGYARKDENLNAAPTPE